MKGIKRIASVVAVEHCELFRLDRLDFLRVVRPYPDMLNKVEQIATDRLEATKQLEDEHRQHKKAISKTEDEPTEEKFDDYDSKKRRSGPGGEKQKPASRQKAKPRSTSERGQRNS